MAFDADLIFDRRRLKRQLTFWRIAALVVLAALVVVAVGRVDDTAPWAGDHVARLKVEGIIFDEAARRQVLKDLAKASHAKALILHVDSPGGTFVGGEALYGALREVAAAKPVVAVLGGTATSAGYMVAAAADHIVARGGTLTGSIGVILQTADLTGLLDKLGIKPEVFKSGDLKAQPNPMEPLSDKARKATQAVLMELYGQFVDLVAERRGMPREKVLALADGRVVTGRTALKEGLVDTLGDEAEARAWLEKAHGIAADTPVHDLRIPGEDAPWRDMLTTQIRKALFSERLRLDGLYSLWHPSY